MQVDGRIGTPSKELLSDARNRSLVEVKQILPPTEHVPDPRDFYASDSPVLDGNFDSDQGLYESAEEFSEGINPEVQLDDEHPRVCFSYATYTHPTHTNYCNTSQQPQILLYQLSPAQHLTPPSQTAHPSLSQQMLPSRPPMNYSAKSSRRDGVSQLQGLTSGGHPVSPIACPHGCPSTESQSADRGQRESHTIDTSLPGQFARDSNCMQGSRGSSGLRIRRRCRWSPQRRGDNEIALAVSSPLAMYFCADCISKKLVQIKLEFLLHEDPPYGRTPEPSQVSAFAAEWKRTGHDAKACDATTTDFMIDIAGLPRSPWNISAGRVFTDYFIRKMKYNDTVDIRLEIEKAFTNRIRSLKSRRKREQLPQAERASERSKHSRQQRKYQVGPPV